MNWQHHLQKLRAAGLTQQQIADACGCAQTTISDLCTGASKQPGYALGVALIELLARQSNGAPVSPLSTAVG